MENCVLLVGRHGRTNLNMAGKFRGDADPPLAKEGFQDANQLAHYLQSVDLSFVVASDKQRSMATADIISVAKKLQSVDGPDLTSVPNKWLWPLSVGKFSGKDKNKENLQELQKYIDDPDLRIPGGESLNEFRSRVRPVIMEAVEYGIKYGVPGLIIAHSSTVHEVGEMFNKDHESALVAPGGLVAVHVVGNKLKASAVFKPKHGEHGAASW